MVNYEEYLKTTNNEKEVITGIIGMFDNSIKFPEGLFNLNLSKNFVEEARDMIIQKVEKFLDDYIEGKINVIILHLED